MNLQKTNDDMIQLILKLKSNTQFVFATLNANVPVFRDAEQNVACEYLDDEVQSLRCNVDCLEIQQRIVDIIEGGSEHSRSGNRYMKNGN